VLLVIQGNVVSGALIIPAVYGGEVSITYFSSCGVYVLSPGKEFALFRGNLADFLTLHASSASARNPIHSCPHLSRLARNRGVGR
jgi:hypothetical protein